MTLPMRYGRICNHLEPVLQAMSTRLNLEMHPEQPRDYLLSEDEEAYLRGMATAYSMIASDIALARPRFAVIPNLRARHPIDEAVLILRAWSDRFAEPCAFGAPVFGAPAFRRGLSAGYAVGASLLEQAGIEDGRYNPEGVE